MNPGKFRHYVDVIGPGTQRDEGGQVIGNPVTRFRNVPCSIETVSGGERRNGQQMQAETTKLVTMRFIEGIETGDKLVEMHGTKVHQEINILAAYDPDGRRRETIVQGKSAA